jgi:competence ComEA-like helix-hairpin-helix protein
MTRTAAFAVLMTVGLLTGEVLSGAPAPARAPLPEGPGKIVVQRMCVGCHTLNVVTSTRTTPDHWSAIVQQMVSRGAEGSDDEIAMVTRYLSANFGPDSPRSTTPIASAQNAPPLSPKSSPATAATVPPADVPQIASPNAPPANAPESAVHVNVNSAGVQELESSLSLTQREAETLIHYREQNGKFKDWQEVAEIPGVPAGKIQDNQKHIVF